MFLVHNATRMLKLNVHEAKTHLSEHLDRLERGEEDVFVICRRNQPIAELRALPRRDTTDRPILRRDPRFQMPASFFEPLPEALIEDFEGS
jgi:antitoxin (DNA-binding transcriptional repressor) of toxin-antitoxin stability system